VALTTRRRRPSPLPTEELDRTPDLVELVDAARDAGHEVALIERPMPDAVSVAGIGRHLDLVSTPDGAAIEDAGGHRLDEERDPDRLAAAARLWTRLAAELGDGQAAAGPPGTGLVALGGFAFDPGRDPAGPWQGFPAVLFRVPALAVTRVRGRTFATGDVDLLEVGPERLARDSSSRCPRSGGGAEDRRERPPGRDRGPQKPTPEMGCLGGEDPSASPARPLQVQRPWRGPGARRFQVEPARREAEWMAAVAEAARRLRGGEADKVVLAREVMAHADGVIAAGAVARALRAAYPACFTYLVAGADGTAFAGASPELLLRRAGRSVTSQPMAGSTARGEDEAEDEALAARLRASAKDATEHRLTARHVASVLASSCERVEAAEPEIVRFTNIQHLATTVRGELREPPPGLLDLAAGLHPTPAINGAPAAAARRLIAELEGLERGWYAGAVGWLDGHGDGELAVAIRCGLLYEDGARLYAGNGMMPDSDPEAELAETRLKLRVLLGALSA
jgi:salicylate biosynthesis isochorismate synthase